MDKMKKLISITLLFIFYSIVSAQTIAIYTKKGQRIRLNKVFTIENGSIVIKDSSLIKKVLPLKSIKKIKYAQKSYQPVGNIFWFTGQWILGCSMLPAVIGYPTLFYRYGGLGFFLTISGIILNNIGAKFGRNVISYKLKGLNYINRELIIESVLADMKMLGQGNNSGEFYYKPHGKKINLPNAGWFLSSSAKHDPRGIEAWIEKHRLREKRFLQLAVPKK